jgi:hypothetical protein
MSSQRESSKQANRACLTRRTKDRLTRGEYDRLLKHLVDAVRWQYWFGLNKDPFFPLHKKTLLRRIACFVICQELAYRAARLQRSQFLVDLQKPWLILPLRWTGEEPDIRQLSTFGAWFPGPWDCTWDLAGEQQDYALQMAELWYYQDWSVLSEADRPDWLFGCQQALVIAGRLRIGQTRLEWVP